ncbi:hypothetical protein [Ruminococcus flavefaciens]|uniref:Uncharacterized protein n=1 Tax=Ruminococcus flavefaciens TaxID=1265 RepID=A0A1K1NBJ2_RUMFL|nr:hypothetical protein [Ruminococcus flavefaciens]SFW32802.1 hypothetical protein SAMN02910280_1807 [Ruminococcus flavefaciens]
MKKQNNLPMPSKWHKRIAAVATAAMMLLSSTPISPLYETFSGWISNFSITAKAAEEDWILAEGETVYSITSADLLSKYSVAYHVNPIGHQNDSVEINMSQSNPTDKVSPFYSLGEGLVNGTMTEVPFRGTITINPLTDSYINIDKALFASIGEEAVIRNESVSTVDDGEGGTVTVYSPRPLWISRTSADNPTEPIFAKKVVAKANGATTSGADVGWEIVAKTFLINGNPVQSTVSGLIGEIDSDCTVKVSFTDERCMNVVSTESAGYICGKLGDRASLEIGSVTSSGVTVSASGSGKHAGAIIGEMGSGAALKLPYDMTSFPVTTVTASGSNGYAGGIVGCNTGGEIAFTGTKGETKYTVNQEINGKIGSGGIFGYYCPAFTNSAAALSYDDINVDCTLKGAGGSGGLFGVLYNSNGSITISDTTGDANHITVNNAGATANYGGLIGSYSAASLDDTLTISSGCTSKPSQGGSSTYYGGAIGTVASAAYVRLNGFSTTAANAANFGGAVGNADGAFIDVNGITVSANEFTGGGVINALGNGVLRMKGDVDLSGAKSKSGQIINTRASGFAFFDESGWTLKRSSSAAGVDDIASWGEVVRFGSTLTQSDVLDSFTDGDHTVILKAAVTSMSSVVDFARTALNIQHNTGDITSGVMTFSGDSSSTLLGTDLSLSTSLTAPLSLAGTGIQGLTRDDASQTYTAKFDGNGKTLYLAIGEAYGTRKSGNNYPDVAKDAAGSGKIYKHSNVGLFGKTNGATIQNVTLDGNIYVCSAATQNVGAAAAENEGGFTAYGVTVSTAMHHSGGSQLCMGGLLGKSTSGSITIGGTGNIDSTSVSKACTLKMDVSGTNSSNSTCIGGAVGLIDSTAFTASINNVTVSGTIKNTAPKQRQEIGGLIAYIEAGTGARALTLDSITLSGLTVEGGIVQTYDDKDKKDYLKDALSIGGLLGYGWYDTTVSLNSVTVSGTPVIRADVDELNGIDVDMAGLVYAGSGSWTVGTVTIPNISVVTYSTDETPVQTNNIRSFGMIVNRSFKIGGNALYLVLPDMTTYTLGTSSAVLSQVTNFPSFNSTTVFDELVAYSAFYAEDEAGVRASKILENGQGIVSIRTRGNTTSTVNNVMKTNTCNTYQNQVIAGTNGSLNMGNPNTRYYYDLDLLLTKKDNATAATPTATLTSSDKLMLWSLNQYAHTSLKETGKPFAYNPFSDNAIAPTGSQTFDMDGYSYYPVDVSGATIKGTFKLHNEEIETGESAAPTPTDGFARTTLVDSVSAFSTTPYTQHHLIQNGIFLNVSGNITINGELKLQGTIGADTYDSTGSGVLICGTFAGDSDNTYTFESKDGSIVLDGIAVHNLVTGNSQLSYAPLLINRIDSYTVININHVSNTDSAVSGQTGYPNGKLAATSLIGKAGKKTNEETSQYIKFKFFDIKLDAREADLDDSTDNAALTSAYHTTRSIFTRATLIEEYVYTGGGSWGEYNFKHSDDWGSSSNGTRDVTYGKEIGYTSGTGEFGGKENRYSQEDNAVEGTIPYYVRPDKDPSVEANNTNSLFADFGTKFLPYVKGGYVAADNKHQIKVNHGTPLLTGCGTYNDPYVITSGDQLCTFANILNGNHTNAAINIPINGTDRDDKWHGTNGCQKYTWNGSSFIGATSGSLKQDVVMKYVASAYYKFDGDFDIPSSFVGLGSNTNIGYVFHGVIDGNGSTVENKSGVPLILNSSGSVVRNLTIKVKAESDIMPYVRLNNSSVATTFGLNSTLEAYGAVIGKIHGGDNIIEHITVDYSTFSNRIKLTNTYAKDTPVGGYVGVVIAGAVIFKDMKTISAASKDGLPGAKVVYNDGETDTSGLTTNPDWLYVNPIIGRVINGYAVTESDAYRPFESGVRCQNDGTTIDTYWISGSASKTAPNNQAGTDRVTMHNGTKNYSITDIVKETGSGQNLTPYPMLQIGLYGDVADVTSGTNLTQKTTVTFPNAQSMFILSCLMQSGITSSSSDSYSYSNVSAESFKSYEATWRPSRLADYDNIGHKAADGSVITDSAAYEGYDDYLVAKDVTTITPYLVKNYVAEDTGASPKYRRNGVFRVSNTNTVCDIGFSGDAGTWYLPDGFRGLGSVAFNVSTNANTALSQVKNMTLSVNKVSGLIGTQVVNLNLNMSIKNYETGFENYKPYSNSGFGLFNIIRHNRTDQTPAGAVPTNLENRTDDDYKIMYLDISGKIDYDVIHSSGTMEYNRSNVLGGSAISANYMHAGGLAGYSGFESTENLNVEHIGIDGLTVNGFKTAGGIIGYMKMANSSDYLATISNINTDELTVTSKLYVGGLVGYTEQIGITIDSVEITTPDIRTYFIGSDYNNGVGGVIGYAGSNTGNKPITISNVTIGDYNASDNAFIGRDSHVPLYDNDTYNKIATGGIIGECDAKSSITIDMCSVYNTNIYGNRVAGIMGHSGSNGSITFSNVEVKSNQNSVVQGMTYSSDLTSRGCSGILGYISLGSSKYVHFDHCTLDGYKLSSYNDTGGLCANLQGSGGTAEIKNVQLNNVKYESNYAGGMIGYLDVNTNGYNIQAYNLQFKKYDTNKDYLRKGNAVLVVKNQKTIKVVGFSWQNTGTLAPGYDYSDRITSCYNKPEVEDKYHYGTNGYVIFSDYQGTSSTEQINDWYYYPYEKPIYDETTLVVEDEENMEDYNEYNTFSPVNEYAITSPHSGYENVSINSHNSVELPKAITDNGVEKVITNKDGEVITYKKYYPIAQNFPFVTSSPFMNIGVQSTDEDHSNKKHMQFLTGDGVSSLSYEESAAYAILRDLQLSTKPKNYYNKVTTTQLTKGIAAFDTLISTKYTTFKTITSTEYPDEMDDLKLDFPVLVVDDNDGTTLTYMLNNYLRVLTNTDYNFAANNKTDVFNLKLAKCTFNTDTSKFDVTYNTSTTQTDNSCLYVDNGNFAFNINRVDSGKAQFTLIDVEFYDPATSGDNKKVAYHLYVPVYVSQMLKFDYRISSKSGSSYKLTQYTNDRGNATLENVGTPITIEARYIYQRELSEWQKALENGESILRTYDKVWDINDNTHKGFPAGTKMILVDPNQGNKAFYSTLNDGQVYGTGTGVVTDQKYLYSSELTDEQKAEAEVHKLYLNNFVSQETEIVDGNTVNKKFTSNLFNKYLDITMAGDSTGKFIETDEEHATFTAKLNGATKFFKPKGSDSGTTYKISSIAYSEDASTDTFDGKQYLIEDYYVTIFTQKTNDETMYHYAFIAPDDLGDINYPSRYTRLTTGSSKENTRIVTGNLFEFVDAELTTTIKEGSNGSYSPKSANDVDIGSVITVDVTNKICLTDQMYNNRSFLDNPTVKISQIFMLSMNKQTGINQTSRGIEAKPAVKMNVYNVGTHDIKTETTRYATTNPNYDLNYIYLGNGQDLRVMLRNATQTDGVLIHANFDLNYSNTGDIANQYPQREEAQLDDETIGTWIGCNSSIASTESAAIASKMTMYIDEKTADSTNDRNLYYSRSSSTASLLYSSDDFDGKYSGGNLYDQLGINAKDLPTTVTGNMCPMNTVVVYDVSKLMSIIDDSAGVELTFRLVRKDANGKYTQELDIADYLTDPTFKTLTVTKDTTNSNSKIYTYRFEKANLAGVYNGGVYTIPIDFTVKTNFSGTDLTDHYYSNYKVIVSASLYEMKDVEVEGQTTQQPVQMSGTIVDDHLIYTNAKIDESVFD